MRSQFLDFDLEDQENLVMGTKILTDEDGNIKESEDSLLIIGTSKDRNREFETLLLDGCKVLAHCAPSAYKYSWFEVVEIEEDCDRCGKKNFSLPDILIDEKGNYCYFISRQIGEISPTKTGYLCDECYAELKR